MFRLIVYFVLGFSLGCSSEKTWNSKPQDADAATVKRKKKVNYGPKLSETEGFKTAFSDQSARFGLEGLSASSINVVDLNFDGKSDLVLVRDYFSQPEFYFFDTKEGKFKKGEYLFDDQYKASFILFYDITGDRIPDALVGVLNQGSEVSERPVRLLVGYKKGASLRFREKEGAIRLPPGPTATLGLLDFDLDGDLDIYVGNWFKKIQGGSLPEKDYLLENRGGRFYDKSELLVGENTFNPDRTMRINAAPVFSSQICDMDLNGYPDILSVSTNGYSNKLWMNERAVGARVFRDIGAISSFAGDPEGLLNARGGGRTFSTACADYNHDGIMDAFVGELSHNHDSESVDRSSILTGSTRKYPPKFIRTEYVLDADDPRWSQSDKRGVWFDYNNDGLLDLLVDNSGYPPHTRMLLFKQFPDHSFENVAKKAGVDIVNPLSSVVLDVNQDGKLDILTAQSNLRDAGIKQRLYLFVNQSADKNRSIRFHLGGYKGNSQGLNATVELRVETANGIERRLQQAVYSYGGLPPQNEESLLFGLKEGEKALSVKVTWPFSKNKDAGRGKLEKSYSLGKLKFDHFIDITLCEAGVLNIGKKECPVL